MNRSDEIDIQIARGFIFDSPRGTFLKSETDSFDFLVSPSYDYQYLNRKKLSCGAFILDTGCLVNFTLTNENNLSKYLNVKTSNVDAVTNELKEDQSWSLPVPEAFTNTTGHFLFSSDLTYCLSIHLERPKSLDNVVKSIVRISMFSFLNDTDKSSIRSSYELHKNIQCIRSTKKVTSIKVCMSTNHTLCIVLNYENPKDKTVQVLKVHHRLSQNDIDVDLIKQIRLSPILTYIRDLSFNQFGDKLIVECAKDFAICPMSTEYVDKCKPFQGSHPFITYNVSLKMELLIRDSYLELGSCIEIYEIKSELSEEERKKKQLSYSLIWKVTAEELGLHRVHVFQVQSFTETLIFYNQSHTIHVLNPFKKKIINQLEMNNGPMDLLCRSCMVDWSCHEVYVKFIDSSRSYCHLKVYQLKSPFTYSLLDQAARKVLNTFSIDDLSKLNLPNVFRKKLGYF
uniref:Uncharacterized protein n=1 Tax=Clytia hemisphaerica TaxID=252671 RepID=A0A7M5X1V0_9CNID